MKLDLDSLSNLVKHQFISEYSSMFKQGSDRTRVRIKSCIKEIINKICANNEMDFSKEEKDKLIEELTVDFLAFGRLTPLIEDDSVSEIMVNGPSKIFVERNGKTELTDIKFDTEAQLMHLVQNMLAPTRRRVDESSPYTDLMLSDNSRVNIVLEPVSLQGPLITIRKFMKGIQKVEDLIGFGSLDEHMGKFLIAAIKAKLNMVFSGATGAGKTTTLNVLSHYISSSERIITIEDAAELNLSQDHVVRLEAKLPNIEGKGEITIRDLFRNSLRMRPNRIILGEVRGVEALDLLQAISSGHSGSLTVIHASSPFDVLARLETMILMAGVGISPAVVRRQLANCIDVVIQHEQLSDGSRKLTHISCVKGMNDGEIDLVDLFKFEQSEISQDGQVAGSFHCSGERPVRLQEKFKKYNLDIKNCIPEKY
ncbi:MAG: CpaF family protein [Candidatus Gygaella obscura]|nr:CpaF family protein [Candidatus Gygaella obscura]